MRRLVWILSAGALAGVLAVLLNVLKASSDIAVHRRVVYRSSDAESGPAKPPAALAEDGGKFGL